MTTKPGTSNRDPHNAVPIIRFDGEIDLRTEAQFAARIDEARQHEPRAILIDLREVTFFGSAGIRLLADLERECSRHGGRLTVLPSPPVRKALRLIGMIGRFDLGGRYADVA